MWRRVAVVASVSVIAVQPTVAQSRPVIDTIPALHDLAIGGVFAVSAALVSPFDGRLAVAAQKPAIQHSTILRDGARVFNQIGDPGTVILALGTYAGGLIAHDRNVAGLGLHATEALAISSAAGALIKGLAGRERPFVDLHETDDFRWGRGFGSATHSSLPSGHTTAAFTLAAVASAETSRHWPHAAKWVIPVAYTAASLVGLARIQSNQHWVSDVLAGAGLGTASGLLVVHFNEAHESNVVERTLLPSP